MEEKAITKTIGIWYYIYNEYITEYAITNHEDRYFLTITTQGGHITEKEMIRSNQWIEKYTELYGKIDSEY